MSTHALIIRQSPEGLYEARYHHLDGHPRSLGKTLLSTFNTEERISELFSVPYDVHTINRDVNEKVPEDYGDDVIKMYDKQVVFFKDEPWQAPEKERDSFFASLNSTEYQYFFDPAQKAWLMAQHMVTTKEWGWMPLEAAYPFDDILNNLYHTKAFTRETYKKLRAVEDSVQGNASWKNFVAQEKENSETYIKLHKFYIEDRLHDALSSTPIITTKPRI